MNKTQNGSMLYRKQSSAGCVSDSEFFANGGLRSTHPPYMGSDGALVALFLIKPLMQRVVLM